MLVIHLYFAELTSVFKFGCNLLEASLYSSQILSGKLYSVQSISSQVEHIISRVDVLLDTSSLPCDLILEIGKQT